MYVNGSSVFERMKRKENKEWKRSTVKHKEVGNIEDKIFVIFDIFLKQSKKIKKTHGY